MNVLVAQSGGPTPVINMSLRGCVEQALATPGVRQVFGSRNGVEGILANRLIPLGGRLDVLEAASAQPGALLGGSRYALKEEDARQIIKTMEELDIGVFCYIGGNGSSRTVKVLHRLAREADKPLRFVHIPKTIDNDLYGTDHTPGFGSAAKFIAQAVQWIGMDMRSLTSYDKVELVEVMGGNSGWLAAASALYKKSEGDFPQIVCLAERETDLETCLNQIESAYTHYGSVMMIVPDHMKIRGMQSDQTANHPRSGYNGGISGNLAVAVRSRLGLKTRVTSPGTLFRCMAGLVSASDMSEARLLGAEAVRYAFDGYSGGMVSLTRISNTPYECKVDWADLDEIAGKEKPLPPHFWDYEKQMPTEAFREYLLPLVDGQPLPRVSL